MSCARAACRATPCLIRVLRRPPAPAPPRRLRGRAREPAARGPLPRRRQGMWAGRGAEPLLGGGPLGLHRLGRALPRGDGRRHVATPSIPACASTAPPGSTSTTRPATAASRSPHPPGPSSTSRPRSTTGRCAAPPGGPSRSPRQHPPARRRSSPATGAGAAPQARPHHRHRPRADPQRARGRRARPHPARRPRAPAGERSPAPSAAAAIVPDFRWPEQRLVVEADGAAWHDNQLAREDDAERQALLEAHGERVLRVTWDQAIARPGQTLARIGAAGAPLASPSVEFLSLRLNKSTLAARGDRRRCEARPTLSGR